MKSVFIFLTSFGFCLILSLLCVQTTYNLDWNFVNANQQKTIGQTSNAHNPNSRQMLGTVVVTPAAPTGESVQLICPGVQIQSSDITISYQSGATIKWYNSISSTSPLPSSTFCDGTGDTLRVTTDAIAGYIYTWYDGTTVIAGPNTAGRGTKPVKNKNDVRNKLSFKNLIITT